MEFLEYVQQEYQTIDFCNYLVLKQKKELHPIMYCCKMIERNQIQGLLPMYTKQVNDRISFYYDISGKMRLVDYLQRNVCTEMQGRQILVNLSESLKNLAHYFLQQQFCILDFNYVFINDAFHVFFPVLPIEELLSRPNQTQLFFQQLVSQYFVTEENNAFYDGLLKYLVRSEFTLDEFIKRVQPNIKPMISQPVKEMAVQSLSVIPLQEKIVKQEEKGGKLIEQKQISSAEPFVNEAGIKIPGATPDTEKSKKEKKSLFGGSKRAEKKEKNEKKPKKEFHLFGNHAEKINEVSAAPVHVAPCNSAILQESVGRSFDEMRVEAVDDATVMLDKDQLGENSPYLLHQNQRIVISKTPFVIGKLNADYHLEKSFISRIHATILEENGMYYLRDENSKNHTYLNGIQLAPYTLYPLEAGSKIKLGLEELIFNQ